MKFVGVSRTYIPTCMYMYLCVPATLLVPARKRARQTNYVYAGGVVFFFFSYAQVHVHVPTGILHVLYSYPFFTQSSFLSQ